MNLASVNIKKIALVLGFLVLAAVIAYFIFALFFKSSIEPTTTPGTETTGQGGALPEAGQGSLTPTTEGGGALPGSGTNSNNQGQTPAETAAIQDISSDVALQASNANIAANGQMRFYNQSDGKFYRVDENGKAIAMSGKRFSQASNVVWSEASNKAVIEFPDGSKVRYNFDTNEQVTLPKHWQDFDFSPSGDKLVSKSMGVDPSNRWLIISNDDGSQAKQIESLGNNGASVISSWSPNNQTIAMYVEGVDYNRKEVFFIGQNGENFKSIITEGRGFQPKWSPDGSELLYSVYSDSSDYKPTLWITSAQGDTIGANRRPLELNTWANKCGYGAGALFCAVPTSLERGAGMFPALADSTPDQLYRIDPATGAKQIINLGSASYTMKNLSVSPDGSYLYFSDAATSQLRRIKLR